MQHLPVHWSEGLFLSAQHFQAAERHWGELLARAARYDQAYFYGLAGLRYSADAIGNLSFQLDACEARTRRGTIVSFGEGEEPDRIDIRDALAAADSSGQALKFDLSTLLAGRGAVRVYLAIPKMRLGTANVGRRGDAGLFRYVELPGLPIQDESSGGNDQEVGFRTLNVKLIAKAPRAAAEGNGSVVRFDDDDPDHELLPVAQVRRGGEAGPELDESYIPPILAVDAWPQLQRGIIQRIHDWIGNRIEILSQQVQTRRITLAAQDPDDLDRLLILMRLNEAYAVLGHLAYAKGVHPFVAYGALAQIVGQLSIFDPSRRVPVIPRYDHDDLGTIFHWMLRQIELYLDLRRLQLPYFFRPFEGRKVGMQVSFEPEWLGVGFKWFVGVNYQHITATQCRGLLAPNVLFWKLASSRQVDRRFENREPGLELVPQENSPKELPAVNWIYFEVSRAGEAWQDVVATQTLAMRYMDKLVDNRGSLEGQRTLVINVPPKKVELQFGLFAVPSRQ